MVARPLSGLQVVLLPRLEVTRLCLNVEVRTEGNINVFSFPIQVNQMCQYEEKIYRKFIQNDKRAFLLDGKTYVGLISIHKQ